LALRRGQQKTHSRFQPWVLVKIFSISTSTNGLAYYEDYYRRYLSDNSVHFADKLGNPWVKGQVSIKTNKPQFLRPVVFNLLFSTLTRPCERVTSITEIRAGTRLRLWRLVAEGSDGNFFIP
jgi:hypothetical protein